MTNGDSLALLAGFVVGGLVVSMWACSGGQPPVVDPVRALSDLKATCAALNAPVQAPRSSGTGGAAVDAGNAAAGAP